MKKIAILFSVILLSTTVYGQFGIKAGLNFNSMKDFNVNELRSSFEGKTGFHVGVLYKLNLPLGFAARENISEITADYKNITAFKSSEAAVVKPFETAMHIACYVNRKIHLPFSN